MNEPTFIWFTMCSIEWLVVRCKTRCKTGLTDRLSNLAFACIRSMLRTKPACNTPSFAMPMRRPRSHAALRGCDF